MKPFVFIVKIKVLLLFHYCAYYGICTVCSSTDRTCNGVTTVSAWQRLQPSLLSDSEINDNSDVVPLYARCMTVGSQGHGQGNIKEDSKNSFERQQNYYIRVVTLAPHEVHPYHSTERRYLPSWRIYRNKIGISCFRPWRLSLVVSHPKTPILNCFYHLLWSYFATVSEFSCLA